MAPKKRLVGSASFWWVWALVAAPLPFLAHQSIMQLPSAFWMEDGIQRQKWASGHHPTCLGKPGPHSHFSPLEKSWTKGSVWPRNKGDMKEVKLLLQCVYFGFVCVCFPVMHWDFFIDSQIPTKASLSVSYCQNPYPEMGMMGENSDSTILQIILSFITLTWNFFVCV